jgi:hypothetical protein
VCFVYILKLCVMRNVKWSLMLAIVRSGIVSIGQGKSKASATKNRASSTGTGRKGDIHLILCPAPPRVFLRLPSV